MPIAELTIWAYHHNLNFFDDKFINTAINTIKLAIIAALLCACFALLINFSIRFKKNTLSIFSNSLLSMGYAVPGLILAVGIVQLFTWIDRSLLINTEIVLTGSLVGLIFAYVIKSYALANSTFESGFERISLSIDDSARTLMSSGWNLILKLMNTI